MPMRRNRVINLAKNNWALPRGLVRRIFNVPERISPVKISPSRMVQKIGIMNIYNAFSKTRGIIPLSISEPVRDTYTTNKEKATMIPKNT
jgi:hypothetical protein